MKLTIKTLQQSTFKVDTESDKTVKDLKEQIEKEQGKDYPSGAQKLIYSGKILADESKLSEYNIDEKKFVVLMITRPPPVPKQTGFKTEPTPAADSKQAKATDDKSSSKSNTSSSASTLSAPSSTATATATATPNAHQPTTRASARLSQPAANPSTTSNTNTNTNANTNTNTTTTTNEASVLSAMAEPQMATRLAMLMSQPQFRQIQDLIQQSPHLLSSTIEALASSDPEMYNFISDNPDVFVSALNHPPMAGMRSQPSRTTSNEQQQARPAEGQQGRQQPGMEQLVGNVSEHDKEAIERLKELGFSEYLAVQAYMACDKDEQLAANLLFQMDQ